MTEISELPNGRTWQDRWGHHAPQLLCGCIAVAIGLGLSPRGATGLSLLLALALIAVVLVTWALKRRHDRRLCEACAASMPLNPTLMAGRYRRRLFLAHQGTNRYCLGLYLTVLIGSNFLTSQPGRYVWAVVQASMIYLVLSDTSHRRLQPWCPWCRGGGGGLEYEQAPEPDGPRGNRLQFS